MDWPKWETAYKTTNYQQTVFQWQIYWAKFFSVLLSFMVAMQGKIGENRNNFFEFAVESTFEKVIVQMFYISGVYFYQ